MKIETGFTITMKEGLLRPGAKFSMIMWNPNKFIAWFERKGLIKPKLRFYQIQQDFTAKEL